MAPNADLRSSLEREDSLSTIDLLNDSNHSTVSNRSKSSLWRKLNSFKNSVKSFMDSSSHSIPEEILAIGVTFDPDVQCVEIPSLDDYSEEEIESIWFTSHEYSAFSESVEKTIMKMEQGKELKEKKYCARGLESMMPEKHYEKGQRRREVFRAVLDEQKAQKDNRVDDPEAIARVYAKRSLDSKVAARLAAQRDESDVRKLMERDIFMAQTLHQIRFHNRVQRIVQEENPRKSIGDYLEEASSIHNGDLSRRPRRDYSTFLRSEDLNRSEIPVRVLERSDVSLRRLLKQDSLRNLIEKEKSKQQRLMHCILAKTV